MRLISLTVLGGVLLTSAATASLYEPAAGPFVDIVVAGQSQTQIVIPAEPTYLEQFAASELQTS